MKKKQISVYIDQALLKELKKKLIDEDKNMTDWLEERVKKYLKKK